MSSSNNNYNFRIEKLKLKIEVDEEENEVNDLKYNMIFIDKNDINNDSHNFDDNKKNNINFKIVNDGAKEFTAHENYREKINHNLKNESKAVSFNSKIFLQNDHNKNNTDSDAAAYWDECAAYTKIKNSTPSNCKEDIIKILKNMKISPVNNSNSSSNANSILNSKNGLSDNSLTKALCQDSTMKSDFFRRSSITTLNSVSNGNFSLQSDQTFNQNQNYSYSNRNSISISNSNSSNSNNKKKSFNSAALIDDLSVNLTRDNTNSFNNHNNYSSKIYINNTTKNNAVSLKNLNFNLIQAANNTRSQNLPTPNNAAAKVQQDFTENKTSNKASSTSNKAKHNLNKLNQLKKGHLKTISINISSVQSPEHNAVYKIETIEQCQNIGFFKIDSNNSSRSKFSFTPTNLTSAEKSKIKDEISPNKIRALPKSTKVGSIQKSTKISSSSSISDNNHNNKAADKIIERNFKFFDNNNNNNENENIQVPPKLHSDLDNRTSQKPKRNFYCEEKNENKDNDINNKIKLIDETFIVRFLIEKYGQEKYLLLRNAVWKSNRFDNKDALSDDLFIDEERVRSIVGEDEFKITMNYIKYFKP